ncbi:MAG: GTPase HflX [Dehalococcoidia bacterium]
MTVRARQPHATARHSTAPEAERAYLAAVEIKGHGGWSTSSSLDELALLADTAGAVIVGRTSQKLEHPHPATYVGKGKLDDIVSLRASLDYTVVIFDDELSPSQQRNLEKTLAVKVIDRTALILDIFARRARTREGRLQVELAQHEYLLPRLAGQWSHLERLGGGIGTRGPGETQIETDRRLIRNRISRLHRELDELRRHRSLYRQRRAKNGVPIVALVGYTNAGKSTLMNALSDAKVLAENRLFATLDPVTRRIHLGPGRDTLLTDTVGFIQKLPTGLVAAFRATLEELTDADLLLHVVDITDPNAADQAETVEATLNSLDVAGKPRLTVLNKVDALLKPTGEPVASLDEVSEADGEVEDRADMVLISAERGWGMADLRGRMAALLDGVPQAKLAALTAPPPEFVQPEPLERDGASPRRRRKAG